MGEGLFSNLPSFPTGLGDDELRFLRSLPRYDQELQTVRQVDDHEEKIARRLARLGLVKIHRWKDDPLAIRPTMYAGRLPAADVREAGHGG